MAETGFGSPTFIPAPTYSDWGFGAATPFDIDTLQDNVVGADTAFGSPYAAVAAEVYLAGEFDLIPDDGGVILEINSDWNTAGFTRPARVGPFTVTYISSETGDRTLAVGLTSRGQCFTNDDNTKLLAGVPPLPHGLYDIEIEWFGGTRRVYIDNAFEVYLRPRSEQAYGIRRHIPSFMARGATTTRDELIQPFSGTTNLAALTKAVGDFIQTIAGRPSTALTADLELGDTSIAVESTVGFPQSGYLHIDSKTFSYSSKTRNSFEGVTCDLYFESIPAVTEVFYARTAQ